MARSLQEPNAVVSARRRPVASSFFHFFCYRAEITVCKIVSNSKNDGLTVIALSKPKEELIES